MTTVPFNPDTQGTIPFPSVDPDAIRGMAAVCSGGVEALSGTGSKMGAARARLTGSWTGQAAQAWMAEGQANQAYCHQAAQAMIDTAVALKALAAQLEEAQAGYLGAARAESGARWTQAVLAAMPIPPDPTSAAQADAQAQVNAENLSAALGAQQQAVDQANIACMSASMAFGAIAASAPNLEPGQPASSAWVCTPSSGYRPSAGFMAILLGSIYDNRLAGRLFQEQGQRGLGEQENHQSFRTIIRGVGGQLREKSVIPDGFKGQYLDEFKNVNEMSNTVQFKAEMALAATRGMIPRLFVAMRTRVSRPAQDVMRDNGGQIYRYDGGDEVTNLDRTQLYRLNPETGQPNPVNLTPGPGMDPQSGSPAASNGIVPGEPADPAPVDPPEIGPMEMP